MLSWVRTQKSVVTYYTEKKCVQICLLHCVLNASADENFIIFVDIVDYVSGNVMLESERYYNVFLKLIKSIK
jgi:general stress protein CsbA